MSESEVDKARREAHNARVEAFSKRTDLAAMSSREYCDALAEMMRPSNIEMLEGFERLGWMAPRDVRHAAMSEVFEEFGFALEPKSGWPKLLFELDLIFVALNAPDNEKGHAELKSDVDATITKLEAVQKTFFEFNHSIDFSWASLTSKADTSDHIPTIQRLISSLETVSRFLAEHRQPPRWRGKAMRAFRIELATKLLTIFNQEFDLMPKPDGGSAAVPIEEANDWTKFFQACAAIRIGEKASPDRQAILWEAFGNW